ncbi:MAG TPA: hypothetical protein VK469_21715 [Candidatus Kapabacteria bacterium]|nr:hypothetical protein [Candidatus Kapabacteria bacterium]
MYLCNFSLYDWNVPSNCVTWNAEPFANSRGQYINSDQYIKSGQYLVSDSGKYFAFMQNDGNFCVYKGSGPNDNQGVVWCVTNIPKPIGNYYAIMQGDGNFCVYKGSGPNDNQGVVWCVTNIPKPIGDYFAIMQDDGNFCVYNGSPKHQGAVVWCCKK